MSQPSFAPARADYAPTVLYEEVSPGVYVQRPEVERVRIERLGLYNAERQRGIVHTDDWRDFMRTEQQWFNDLMRR